MDKPKPISPAGLYLQIGTARAPVIIDARPEPYADSDDRIIVGARELPGNVEQWMEELAKGHSFAVYCGQDEEVSASLAQVLCEFGHKAAYLEGGMAAWMAQGLPTRKLLKAGTNKQMDHP